MTNPTSYMVLMKIVLFSNYFALFQQFCFIFEQSSGFKIENYPLLVHYSKTRHTINFTQLTDNIIKTIRAGEIFFSIFLCLQSNIRFFYQISGEKRCEQFFPNSTYPYFTDVCLLINITIRNQIKSSQNLITEDL